jgi:hypothetical protein
MKNLLISIVAALILCGSSNAASADSVEKNVTFVTISSLKTDHKKVYKLAGPSTVVRKTCKNDKKHECLYVGRAKRELHKFTSDDVTIAFAYEPSITILASN